MANRQFNTAFALRYGLTVGENSSKGHVQLPPGANATVRKKTLRSLYVKERTATGETFSDWKVRRLAEVNTNES
jgi:hypothetical protein